MFASCWVVSAVGVVTAVDAELCGTENSDSFTVCSHVLFFFLKEGRPL